ncbi:MAG: beta strand repeat-containing protein, partial [Roseimicrobium sp.]
MALALWTALPLTAQSVYWDTNGTTAGAGGAAPAGTWDLSLTRWGNAAGNGAPAAWNNTGTDTAIFAAGTDATGAYSVTLGAGAAINLTGLQVHLGTVTLTPASGSDVLNFGAVNGTLNAASGTGLLIAAPIQGSAGITKAGLGSLTLSAANTFTGATALNGVLVTLDYTTQNNAKLDETSALTLAGTSLLITPNASADTAQTVLSTTLNAGSSTITVNKNSGSNNATLNLNAITRSSGGTLNIIYGGTGSGTASVTTDTTNTNSILGGWATLNGRDWAVNSTNAADGAIAALGTYTSDTFAAGNNTDITISGAGPGNPAATTNSLRFNQLGPKTLALGTNAKTIISGGILITPNVGSFTTTINGSNLRAASGADLIFHQYNRSGDVTVGAVITNVAVGGLVKTGPGVLTLSGANTFTGGVRVNQGVLSVGTVTDTVSSNLGIGTTVSLGDGSSTGTLIYTGATASTARSFTLGDGGGVIGVS